MRCITFAIMLLALITLPALAQDTTLERTGVPPVASAGIAEISNEELMDIINRADSFFTSQDIENMAVDIVIYRDPGKELTLDDLKSGDVAYKARFSPIISHYFYESPGWYLLRMMGMDVIRSETVPDKPVFTNLLPLPGGQINIPSIMDNYDIEYLGTGEINERETHMVRISAKNYKEQFIKYSIYEFDTEEGYLSRIESHFDNGYWRGQGSGEFYYRERDGKLLPAYGYGEIFISPFFYVTLWGSWYNWEFNAEDFAETLHRGEEDAFEPIDLG